MGKGGHYGVSAWDVPGLAERLTALVKDGGSATAIAATLNAEYRAELAALNLGGLSRNAVLGRVHREAKTGGPGLRGKPRRGNRPTLPRRPRPMAPYTPGPRKEPAPRAARVAPPAKPREGLGEPAAMFGGSAAEIIAQLTDAMCKWPEGDPGGYMTVCGHPRWAGSHMPYCEHHARRAIDPNGRGRTGSRPYGLGPATVLASEFDASGKPPTSADEG